MILKSNQSLAAKATSTRLFVPSRNQFNAMKYLLTFIVLSLMTPVLRSQTMKWIPMDASMAKGLCNPESGKKQQQLCYVLQYTPAISGVLTSYTTGFFVSCTSMGSAVAKNQSCTMINNVNTINGCDGTGVVLMNSSGNSGTLANSKVEAGVPVIIHQVCFSIPYGESITIKEDPVTDLTTSIDLASGVPQTEYPTFEDVTIRHNRPDVAKPIWLDFKGIPAGERVAQLDWSTSETVNPSHYIVERSFDGTGFVSIGTVESNDGNRHINSYQFFDKAAAAGKNYYRLQQVSLDGKTTYSPVRIVTFSVNQFSVSVTPNPADEYLQVNIQNPLSKSTIKLIDDAGRLVLDEKNDNKLLKSRLDVKKLNPGIYTLLVETEKDTYTEKVVIAHR
jgi:hypothetical protein